MSAHRTHRFSPLRDLPCAKLAPSLLTGNYVVIPLELFFLPGDALATLQLGIGSTPLEVVLLLIEQLFFSSHDLSMAHIIQWADTYKAHPDSIRLTATSLHQRCFLAKHPMVLISMMQLRDPTLPLTSNAVENVAIDLAAVRAQCKQEAPRELACNGDYVGCDQNVFLFQGGGRLSVYGVTSLFKEKHVKELSLALHGLTGVDRTLAERIKVLADKRKWSTYITHHFSQALYQLLVAALGIHQDNLWERLQERERGTLRMPEVYLVREKKVVQCSLKPNLPQMPITGESFFGYLRSKGISMEDHKRQVQADKLLHTTLCVACKQSFSLLRCEGCTDLLYCTATCKQAWTSEHDKVCRRQKNLVHGVTVPPGGPAVSKVN